MKLRPSSSDAPPLLVVITAMWLMMLVAFIVLIASLGIIWVASGTLNPMAARALIFIGSLDAGLFCAMVVVAVVN